ASGKKWTAAAEFRERKTAAEKKEKAGTEQETEVSALCSPDTLYGSACIDHRPSVSYTAGSCYFGNSSAGTGAVSEGEEQDRLSGGVSRRNRQAEKRAGIPLGT